MVDAAEETARWHAHAAWTEVTCTADYAEVPPSVFAGLGDYSRSLPSGTFIGKRWRHLQDDGWWMGEYVDDPDPAQIGIIWRPIYFSYPTLRATRASFEQVVHAAQVAQALETR